MTPLGDGWRRLFRIGRRSPARDVDAELAFHFDERIAELVAGGMQLDEARRATAREFGDVAAVRADLVGIDTRTARRRDLRDRLESVARDIGFVLRSLRRTPGFLAMVSLTLALGIGANVAIFSLLDRLFLAPPPGIAHPREVRRIYRIDPPAASEAMRHAGLSAPVGPTTQSFFDYPQIEEMQAVLPRGATVAGYSWDTFTVGRGADATSVSGTYVLGDYFGMLDVHPALGRLFDAAETAIDAPDQVAIVSEHLWSTQFNRRRDVVGQPVDLNGHRYTIVGVVAGSFHGMDNDASDIWVPIGAERWENDGDPTWYRPKGGGRTFIIRLFTRVRTRQEAVAVAHAATIAFRHDAFRPDSLASSRLGSLVEASIPDTHDKNVGIATRLAGMSIIILLIACANVANLLLARGMRRRREIGVRLALGMSRRRLIGLLLAESIVVAAIGSAAALAVALWAGVALRHVILPGVNLVDAPLNLHVLLFAVFLATCVGVGTGIVPAVQASRPDLTVSLKTGSRDGTYRRSRMRTTLLVAQSALSVVLLAAAGVFLRSLHSVETENIGYAADRVVYGSISLDPDQKALADDVPVLLAALEDRLRQLPGVQGVALVHNTPMRAISFMKLTLPGEDSLPHLGVEGPFVSNVSPGLFPVVGMRILRGRAFTADDRAEDARSIVINQTMARSLWPGRDAIGQCVVLDDHRDRCTKVVGIVTDAHYSGIIEAPAMQFYLPLQRVQGHEVANVIALRSAPGQAELVAKRVKREMNAALGGLGQPVVQRMTDNLANELHPFRTGAALFSVAGLLALLVAAVGVYSTTSHIFSQRAHEIGVRMALGAGAVNVLSLVVLAGIRVVVAGIGIGVALAWATGNLVQSMLYKTSAHDTTVLLVASATLLVVAVLACLVPAWRALRVDPVVALRAD